MTTSGRLHIQMRKCAVIDVHQNLQKQKRQLKFYQMKCFGLRFIVCSLCMQISFNIKWLFIDGQLNLLIFFSLFDDGRKASNHKSVFCSCLLFSDVVNSRPANVSVLCLAGEQQQWNVVLLESLKSLRQENVCVNNIKTSFKSTLQSLGLAVCSVLCFH